MARSYALTFHKARRCWRKKYKGKVYYLGRSGVCKTDDASYKLALAEWEAVKRHADGQGPCPYSATGDFDGADYECQLAGFLADRHLNSNNRHRSSAERRETPALWMATDYSRHSYARRVVEPAGNGDIELSMLFAEYLRQRQAKVEARNLSVKQYAQDRAKLEDFEGFAKHHELQMLSEIDAPFLAFYKEVQERLTEHPDPSERISGETARKRLQTILKVWKWAYKNEYLDRLPRLLDSEFASIKISRPRPVFWTVEEIHTLFNAASQRTKLYIALACNCGYTQREIATLTWEMIDNPSVVDGPGIIRRDRPKSKQRQVHKLWPITLKLLRAESKTRKGLCLVGSKGNDLLTERIKDDGNITHVDSIRLAFDRTLKKTKLRNTGRTFKHIRKTSANAIAEKFEDHFLTDLFLAHSDRAMRNHYAEQHYKRYFDALEWLDSHYNLHSLLPH